MTQPTQPLSRDNRRALQEVLAVGGSPAAQALRRYETTLAALEAHVETLIAALEDYLAPINQGGGSIPRLTALEDAFAAWKDEQPATHTHPCPTCHQARPCTATGCADGPRECATCSQCRGW